MCNVSCIVLKVIVSHSTYEKLRKISSYGFFQIWSLPTSMPTGTVPDNGRINRPLSFCSPSFKNIETLTC